MVPRCILQPEGPFATNAESSLVFIPHITAYASKGPTSRWFDTITAHKIGRLDQMRPKRQTKSARMGNRFDHSSSYQPSLALVLVYTARCCRISLCRHDPWLDKNQASRPLVVVLRESVESNPSQLKNQLCDTLTQVEANTNRIAFRDAGFARSLGPEKGAFSQKAKASKDIGCYAQHPGSE